MLSLLTTALYELGANILTVNQGIPVNNTADVSITVKTDDIKIPISEVLDTLKGIDGVISVKI